MLYDCISYNTLCNVLYTDVPEGLVDSEFTPKLATLDPSKYVMCMNTVSDC